MNNKITETKNNDSRMNLLVSFSLRKKYKQYCLRYNVGMSDRIRDLIIDDLENDKLKAVVKTTNK